MKYKTTYVAGSFDILHSGHVYLLDKAKSESNKLIVGVNTDKCTSSYKGLPVNPYYERAKVIESLKSVDLVIPRESINDIEIAQKYNIQARYITFEPIKLEGAFKENLDNLEKIGVKIIWVDKQFPLSSTLVKERVIENHIYKKIVTYRENGLSYQEMTKKWFFSREAIRQIANKVSLKYKFEG